MGFTLQLSWKQFCDLSPDSSDVNSENLSVRFLHQGIDQPLTKNGVGKPCYSQGAFYAPKMYHHNQALWFVPDIITLSWPGHSRVGWSKCSGSTQRERNIFKVRSAIDVHPGLLLTG